MEVFLGMYGHFSCILMDFSSDFPKKRPFLKFFLMFLNEVGFLRVVIPSVLICFAQFFHKIFAEKKLFSLIFLYFFRNISSTKIPPGWGLVTFEAQ